MARSDGEDSPIDEVSAMVDESVTDAFSLLGNETRIVILLALWDEFSPFDKETIDPARGKPVPFSELRELVGVRDSGQFNYHLGKLEGRFIEATDEGYQLLPSGDKIVTTVIASAGYEGAGMETDETGMSCWHCGAPTAVTYQNQRVYHVCTECSGDFAGGGKHPEGIISGQLANRTVLRERDAAEIYRAINTDTFLDFTKLSKGVCPQCTGPVERRLHVCESHNPKDDEHCPTCGRKFQSAAQFACPVCKHSATQNLVVYAGHHPAMIEFCWEHGYDVYERGTETMPWIAELSLNAEQIIQTLDPPVVELEFRVDQDSLELTYDEKLNVLEVTRSGDYA